ncbi:polysaccharide ABC transporter ATP-binding protein [Marinibactrum halimedae]|uniref:ABC transporter domain-containing protein n=1 Tax=Marinibactrum halimedae TaxID=1444977 RepID=A0AA37WQA4_9GAMM|nr:ABC transporter ATP-binding protein [Marinibactrum halimedae]MCD9459844.1 ATP-binding cassette domain-containing protein [Marinibactrum halimedae]GLS26962.1 hypothetical protein GCM10007877_26810 [Marinibactrum halimedae]
MTRVALKGVTKRYPVNTVSKRAKLKKAVLNEWFGIKRKEQNVKSREAIAGVTFSLSKGESLALIGRNGAGKSTLLKVISGTLSQDEGKVDVVGRVGGLIELGAGLDKTKTGRANVVERAAVLGIPNEKVVLFQEEIEQFSELGEQFDEPVSTYSSGMKARLGFAISVTLPFDIMICDEALSVGDAKFSAKCLAKVSELKKERIFLFVSHSMTMVQRFCEKGIVLDKGHVAFMGVARDAVAYYENNILYLKNSVHSEEKKGSSSEQDKEGNPSLVRSKEKSSSSVRHKGDDKVVKSFLDPLIVNNEKVVNWDVGLKKSGGGLVFDWDIVFADAFYDHSQLRMGFPIFSDDGQMMFSCTKERFKPQEVLGSDFSGKLIIPSHGLHPGNYYCVVALYDGIEPILRQLICEFKVGSDGVPKFGLYNVDSKWILN